MSMPTCPSCVYAQGICEKTGVKIRHSTGCTYHTPKRITKADLIRAMSDEELAEFVAQQLFCAVSPMADKLGIDITQMFVKCRDIMLDWLRQEASND